MTESHDDGNVRRSSSDPDRRPTHAGRAASARAIGSGAECAGQVRIGLPRLQRLVFRALRALQLSARQAHIVRDVLMYAQIRGNPQGLIKIVERSIVPGASGECEIEQPRPAIARIRANGESGMVVLHDASERLIEMTRLCGLALVSTVGTSTSSGALGYYAARIARQGLIGIVTAGSPKTMALHGGTAPVLGSNALAIALPRRAADPLILDMTTAATSVFALHAARRRGDPIAAGVAIDAKGEPTTDPVRALAGALRSFGGARGSGLALMLECLTGPLAGGAIVGDETDSRGNLLLGIDPAVVAGDGDFDSRLSALLNRLQPDRAARPDATETDTRQGPRLPGTVSAARAAECQRAQSIMLEAWLLEHLRTLALTARSGRRS